MATEKAAAEEKAHKEKKRLLDTQRAVLSLLETINCATISDISEWIHEPDTSFLISVLISLGKEHGDGKIKREVINNKSYYSLV